MEDASSHNLKREAIEDAEGEAFLPCRSSDEAAEFPNQPKALPQRCLSYLRLFLEFTMAAAIVLLLAQKPSRGGNTIKRSPVPQLPRKIYTFRDDPRYVHGAMWFNESDTLHTLHNWIELSSASRGYVVIDDAPRYDLPKPYTIAINRFEDGPGYMMSVFHQLHCLSYLAEHYQQGYSGTELTEKVAHHSAHCFNYLRQGIMCSADTTLEGSTDEGPGEGSEHECVDYDALLEWADDHAGMKWRGLLPDEATL